MHFSVKDELLVTNCRLRKKNNYLWQDHGNWLAQHHSFGLDTSDTPSEDAETVDHRRMRIYKIGRYF